MRSKCDENVPDVPQVDLLMQLFTTIYNSQDEKGRWWSCRSTTKLKKQRAILTTEYTSYLIYSRQIFTLSRELGDYLAPIRRSSRTPSVDNRKVVTPGDFVYYLLSDDHTPGILYIERLHESRRRKVVQHIFATLSDLSPSDQKFHRAGSIQERSTPESSTQGSATEVLRYE